MPFFVAISAYIEYLQRIWVNKLNIVTRNLRFPLLSIMLIIYTSVLIINIIPVYVLVTNISAYKVFWVQEFNGWLPNKWKHSIQIARDINRKLKDESQKRRILSTYSSGIDVLATFNPTGIDYIIHALGTPARSHYIESLLSSKPKYITTLREDYTHWETWVRRTNWWFYREFVRDYKPVEATFYNIIWQRLENPKKQVYPLAIYRIDKDSNNKTIINVLTNKRKNNTVHYAKIDLKY